MDLNLRVIIPAKNEAKYLPRCFENLEKAVSNWGGTAEIILVDNGSTDQTKEIAEANGCIIIEEPFGTIARLRNLGARNAMGNIIAFLDADCLVAPNWISFCLENFINARIAMVGTRAVPDFANASWVEKRWYELAPGGKRPDFVDWLGSSNLFIRKDVFEEGGGFNENLLVGEDVDLSYRIGRNHLISLEKRVDTIHLRESKTIAELFKREYWRGKSSISTYIGNNFTSKELPSVAIPAINLISMMLVFVFGFLRSNLIYLPLAIVLSFPILFILKKKPRIKSAPRLLGIYVVAFTYIMARSCSLVYEILYLLRAKK